ncbi:hypothetical protein D9611_003490 [Ephemerocybe angulata]|uniref:XPG-I domain-containing protein n=1 Tax=Ephemerocybe angulata TaxID=980116 RepID=A0A8H5B6N9_9AGAR|nr:hypothetical protein D9611_003490 [Tulosesus angulatus]
MGISKLWEYSDKFRMKALRPAADVQSFSELITSDALTRRMNGESLPIIGVDASPLMYAAKAAAANKAREINSCTQIGRETEVACLRLSAEQWTRLPALIVVVFDGPQRPRSSGASKFGPHRFISWSRSSAPGEAEAHLAMLNKTGKIHYVLTCDSDVFLFGAETVIRTPHNSANRDEVEVYTASALETHDAGLSLHGLILIAILAGGDYAEGVMSFELARKLARTSLAFELYIIIQTETPLEHDPAVSMYHWRKALRAELVRGTRIGRRALSVAAKLPEVFPSSDLVGLYVNPVVGPSDNSGAADWAVQLPNSAAITRLASVGFRWSWTRTVDFLREVWAGYILHHFLTGHIENEAGEACPRCLDPNDPYIIHFGTSDGNLDSEHPAALTCRIRIGIRHVESAVVSAWRELNGHEAAPNHVKATGTILITLPALVVLFGAPELVDRHCAPSPLSRVLFHQCIRYMKLLREEEEVALTSTDEETHESTARQGGRGKKRVQEKVIPSYTDAERGTYDAAKKASKAKTTLNKYSLYWSQLLTWVDQVSSAENAKAKAFSSRQDEAASNPAEDPDNDIDDELDPSAAEMPEDFEKTAMDARFPTCLIDEPTECTTTAMAMFLWDKVYLGKLSVSTADQIAASFIAEYDARSTPHGFIYKGTWRFDEFARAFRGNPGCSDRVKQVLNAIKKREDQPVRKHSRAMSYDDMVAIHDTIKSTCPPPDLVDKPSLAK